MGQQEVRGLLLKNRYEGIDFGLHHRKGDAVSAGTADHFRGAEQSTQNRDEIAG